ncbi:MAG: hypothetical protein N2439_02610, partial [Anaerolineae bacterium]|nr:hypothetical protein [Anaerolineae bacterium]
MKKFSVVLALFVIAGLLLASCGGAPAAALADSAGAGRETWPVGSAATGGTKGSMATGSAAAAGRGAGGPG